ncbi:uncharacterized protein I303_107621 [Kwoniella dejecticola CBS 10117]|uniref:Uncharacterized protein n=1 Tax=Kwoniella dejecticola CBS 10117 TaxID=1296121 RepID=A0A1A5ZV88_9TREE|nr:uncharacterized protein I303_07632 [Kwoniella dejecticola CBS 10117]OBR81722.1 hypothetical protein I303_07632 [Kwoniella dejecticola CBS 10117]
MSQHSGSPNFDEQTAQEAVIVETIDALTLESTDSSSGPDQGGAHADPGEVTHKTGLNDIKWNDAGTHYMRTDAQTSRDGVIKERWGQIFNDQEESIACYSYDILQDKVSLHTTAWNKDGHGDGDENHAPITSTFTRSGMTEADNAKSWKDTVFQDHTKVMYPGEGDSEEFQKLDFQDARLDLFDKERTMQNWNYAMDLIYELERGPIPVEVADEVVGSAVAGTTAKAEADVDAGASKGTAPASGPFTVPGFAAGEGEAGGIRNSKTSAVGGAIVVPSQSGDGIKKRGGGEPARAISISGACASGNADGIRHHQDALSFAATLSGHPDGVRGRVGGDAVGITGNADGIKRHIDFCSVTVSSGNADGIRGPVVEGRARSLAELSGNPDGVLNRVDADDGSSGTSGSPEPSAGI